MDALNVRNNGPAALSELSLEDLCSLHQTDERLSCFTGLSRGQCSLCEL